MCRITGILHKGHTIDPTLLNRMRDSMIHGGPDAGGSWIGESIGLGHRRLSIIDLSANANQPFHWRQYVMVYNGEIYNYRSLRDELSSLGYDFQTDSDTEVLITAFHEWGEEAPKRFHGMFAFAIWDKEKQQLWLCRDRVGVKPLYVYHKADLMMFASELKALMVHPAMDRTINHQAVATYMHYGYIPAPASIYQYVHKIMPGVLECWTDAGLCSSTRFWDTSEVYATDTFSDPRALEEQLTQSFEYRMVADVPVGVFLSGGVDSSLLAAVLARNHEQPLKTFTIGFKDKELDEAPQARAIAKHLETEHQEYYCSEEDFVRLVPDYFQMYDEPFGDSSGIPTHLVAQFARESVKVALSADGADELFGGYTKYRFAQKFNALSHSSPKLARSMARGLLKMLAPLLTSKTVEKGLPIPNWKNKFNKGMQALSAQDLNEFFMLASGYLQPDTLSSYHLAPLQPEEPPVNPREDKLISYLGMKDILHYLEGDIMCKVDRASMYTGLECREPFLDQHLISYGLQLGDRHKLSNGKNKALLRKLLYTYLPSELIDRPKQGFRVPIGKWLKTHYKDQLLALSQDNHFYTSLAINPQFSAQRIHAFLKEKSKVSEYEIWFLFALYRWYRAWHKA